MEVIVVAAIAAILLGAAIPLAAGLRPAGASAAVLQLDAVLARAQAAASTSGNGATIQFLRAPAGFSAIVYAGRPDGRGMSQTAPPDAMGATIRETSLGAPPFTVYFDSSGHASAASGTVDQTSSLSADPGCPSNAAEVTLIVSDARTAVTRSLPCAPQ